MPEKPTLEAVLKQPTYHGLNAIVQGEPLEKIEEVVRVVLQSGSSPAAILLMNILSDEARSHERLQQNLVGDQRQENERVMASLRALTDRLSAEAARAIS